MMTRPLVSALVLNFNGEDHLDACLSTLTEQSYADLEIVVADNGSTDSSADVVAGHGVRWEPLGTNHGVGPGFNLGAARCSGEIVIFLNNDMRFDARFVESLVEPFLGRSDVFATDARQYDWEGVDQLHGATRLVRTRPFGRRASGTLLPLLDISMTPLGAPAPAIQACAAHMAVRREMFDALSGFDARLPAGWEDTEICWRAWRRGWATVYVPSAICWHRVGASSSSGEGAWFRYRGSVGGRLLFATKHLPLEYAALTWGRTVAGALRDLMLGRLDEVRKKGLVLREFGRYLPGLLAERRRLYGSEAEVRSQFSRMLAVPTSPLAAEHA